MTSPARFLCQKCGGLGRLFEDSGSRKCPDCDGAGYREVRIDTEDGLRIHTPPGPAVDIDG